MSEATPTAGILEVHDKGYGFLRKAERASAPTPNDVFVPPDFIKRSALRDGLMIDRVARANARGPQLTEILKINDLTIEDYKNEVSLEELTTINPSRWIK